jgi:hypothetical protein
MGQIITIECSSCEAVAKEESDRCILILWRGDNIGLLRHDICPSDLLDAVEELLSAFRREEQKKEKG